MSDTTCPTNESNSQNNEPRILRAVSCSDNLNNDQRNKEQVLNSEASIIPLSYELSVSNDPNEEKSTPEPSLLIPNVDEVKDNLTTSNMAKMLSNDPNEEKSTPEPSLLIPNVDEVKDNLTNSNMAKMLSPKSNNVPSSELEPSSNPSDSNDCQIIEHQEHVEQPYVKSLAKEILADLRSDRKIINRSLQELYCMLDLEKCKTVGWSITTVNNVSVEPGAMLCCSICHGESSNSKKPKTIHFTDMDVLTKHFSQQHKFIDINKDKYRWSRSWTYSDRKHMKYFDTKDALNCSCKLCDLPLTVSTITGIPHLKTKTHHAMLKSFVRTMRRLPDKYIEITEPNNSFHGQILNPHELLPSCCCRRVNCHYCPNLSRSLLKIFRDCKKISCEVCKETFDYKDFISTVLCHSVTDQHHNRNMNRVIELGYELPFNKMFIPVGKDKAPGDTQQKQPFSKNQRKRGKRKNNAMNRKARRDVYTRQF